MFEQSLYETELVATPLKSVEDSDLFREYELKNWEFNPRIYKILGVATVFNLFALLIFSQTSVLTAKGCDSPLVGSVCSVLDTVYVGSLLFGTNREYVDVAYEKTDLGDADITFVDVSNVETQIQYPNSFKDETTGEYVPMIGQPAMAVPVDQGFIASGFPSGITTTMPSMGDSLIDTKPNIPKANPNVIAGDLPTIDDRTGLPDTPISRPRTPGFGRIRTPRTTPITPKPTPDPNTTAVKPKTDPQVKVDPTDPVADDAINKRPFKDLGNIVNDLLARKEIDLEKSQFLVEATGKLDKDGKLEKKTFRFTKAISTDPKMVDVVKKSIEAFNDSGLLKYLKDLSGKDLRLSIKQDQTVIAAVVQSELDRDTRAASVASALKFGVGIAQDKKKKAIAQMQAENNPDKAVDLQNEIDDLQLLENTQITSDGKSLVITFNVQKTIVQQMIQRKLAEQAKELRQPNGNAVTKPANNATK